MAAVESLAYAQNPWWEWSDWFSRDRDLRSYERMRVKWRPGWLSSISLEPFSLNFIVGPRQVGKTTGVKILVSELLRERDPFSVFYFNCDLAVDARELRRVLDLYRGLKQAHGVKSSVVILDEVTGLEDWWRVVKGYIDLGYFDEDVLILLGSASFRIRAFAEAFPGRRGKGVTVEVLPLAFHEYVSAHGVEPRASEASRISSLFKRYLETGGFPRSINGDEKFAEDLVASVERDAVKAGRNPKLLRLVARELIAKAPSALSFNAVAGELGVSHNTVHEYVKLLEDMFLVSTAYMKHGDRVLYRREKKIFFRDPFAARAFASLLGVEASRAALLEWVVQEHVLRKFGEVYFWHNGYEVDVIAGNLKLEVKTGKPHRRYPRSVTVLSEESIPAFLLELARS
ncbi:MAG: ATP-binding protein [Thermofilum sp.]